MLAARAAIYRSLWPLQARNRKKVSKRVFVGSAEKYPRYHWGQNDYLPNLYSRRIMLGNSIVFRVYKRELVGELILRKITLPKSVSN